MHCAQCTSRTLARTQLRPQPGIRVVCPAWPDRAQSAAAESNLCCALETCTSTYSLEWHDGGNERAAAWQIRLAASGTACTVPRIDDERGWAQWAGCDMGQIEMGGMVEYGRVQRDYRMDAVHESP